MQFIVAVVLVLAQEKISTAFLPLNSLLIYWVI